MRKTKNRIEEVRRIAGAGETTNMRVVFSPGKMRKIKEKKKMRTIRNECVRTSTKDLLSN